MNNQTKFLIRGGYPLKGEIEVRGAKNSALKVLASSILFSGPITIENIPLIEDVFRMKELLIELGVSVKSEKKRSLKLKVDKIGKTSLNREIAERLRASVVLVGPLLAREKSAFFPHPGGCVIGKRPIDVFLDGFKAMGATFSEKREGYSIRANSLKGTDFTFRIISVTGTETLMMTAALANGKTVLRNAACEPEVSALAEFLNSGGAKIKGAGTHTIEIEGTRGKLLKGRRKFEVIPDRIEAGSFLILGAALGKNVKVKKCNPDHLSSLIASLEAANIPVIKGSSWISVKRPKVIKSINLKTKEYPGFPTDLQAPFTTLMTQARGTSMIFETVFEGRLSYTEDLNRMGANITICDPHRILVNGPTPLDGRDIESPDIRAGLAFIFAALIARGKSYLRNVYQVDRGYEKIEERLKKLGAHIERLK